MAENPNQEIKVTVDGGQFYSFVRALKRSSRASDLGEVVMSLGQGKLTIETRQGGSILPCGECPPAVARIKGGNFLRMVSLVTDAKASGPLVIVFRPNLGKVGLPHSATKAKFDQPA